MSDASFALQEALRARLVAFAALTALVPASNILDRSGPATRYPAVMIGEGQSLNVEMTYARDIRRVFLDLHIWSKSDDLGPVKMIAGEIQNVLRDDTPWAVEDHHVVDLLIPMQRYMRDRQSETPLAHAVITVSALMQEIWH